MGNFYYPRTDGKVGMMGTFEVYDPTVNQDGNPLPPVDNPELRALLEQRLATFEYFPPESNEFWPGHAGWTVYSLADGWWCEAYDAPDRRIAELDCLHMLLSGDENWTPPERNPDGSLITA